MIRDYFNKNTVFCEIIIILILVLIIFGITFAFFNYTRTGLSNTIATGSISFEFNDSATINIGNAFPISESDIDNTINKNFTITAHTTLSDGINYRIYAIYGDEDSSKTRLLDNVVTVKFTPPSNGDGFTTVTNYYSTPSSLTFVNGKAMISTGTVKNTSDLTTKEYNLKLWIDSSKLWVSSTTKRQTLAEGNPSLADATSGTVTAGRYMKNDDTLETVSLYPAKENQVGKIIYTTKEFSTSYYSIRIVIESENIID